MERIREGEFNRIADDLDSLATELRRATRLPRVLDLYKDTGYGDDVFSILKNWQQFPIVQRNILILIARNYVEHPIDGDTDTPFATNSQTSIQLPVFNSNDAPTIAMVLDGLVVKMRRERAKAASGK